jgi:hypothetical protein
MLLGERFFANFNDRLLCGRSQVLSGGSADGSNSLSNGRSNVAIRGADSGSQLGDQWIHTEL